MTRKCQSGPAVDLRPTVAKTEKYRTTRYQQNRRNEEKKKTAWVHGQPVTGPGQTRSMCFGTITEGQTYAMQVDRNTEDEAFSRWPLLHAS